MSGQSLKTHGNHYNCPIVTSYAENIKNNVEELRTEHIRFENPFIAFTNLETVTSGLKKAFPDIPASEAGSRGQRQAGTELAHTRQAMYDKGQETLQYLEGNRTPRYRARRTPVPY